MAAPAAADGPRHDYAIAIGYNGVPADDAASLQPLRFADDDAIAFAAFAAETTRRVHLLTVADADTQRRLGAALPPARPPSLAEVRAAVADIRAAIEDDARNHARSAVYVYYSGHGTAGDSAHEPSLALIDGTLTRSALYDGVLAELSAANVHLFVDACHAEAVVRPRDLDAQVVATSDEDRGHYALASTLARFPNTGAVIASTRGAQAHEWDAYLGGVFTHELLSGLRGAADVNADGRIEYSELAAFLSAANGSVRDPRARLESVTHAPNSDPSASIVEKDPRTNVAVLDVRGVASEVVFVEDDRGDRLADVRPESGYGLRLALPADRTWYVHTSRGEAEVRPAPGALVSLASLALHPPSSDARGTLEAALHEGLFATPFGPSYYRGFVDAAPGMAPVLWAHGENGRTAGAGEDSRTDPARAWAWTSTGASVALAAGAGVFGWMAARDKSEFDSAPVQGLALDPSERYHRDTTFAFALGAGAIVGAALATYLFLRPTHDSATARLGREGVVVHF